MLESIAEVILECVFDFTFEKISFGILSRIGRTREAFGSQNVSASE